VTTGLGGASFLAPDSIQAACPLWDVVTQQSCVHLLPGSLEDDTRSAITKRTWDNASLSLHHALRPESKR
jgi:hypothetical protein